MNEIVAEWAEKAESDYRVAEHEVRVRRAPSYDMVCFHKQQCAENHLKALLSQRQIPFRPIHDLEILPGLAIPASPDLEVIRARLLLLNDHAVDVRYPGESAIRDEARAAVQAVRAGRSLIRPKLGLIS